MKDIDFSTPVANTSPGVLSNLWRRFIVDNRLIGHLPRLVDRYLNKDKTNRDVPVVKKKNRSTMFKNISAREMTIKTFLDLMFNLVGTKKIVITIEVELPTGKTTKHSVTVTQEATNKEADDATNDATSGDSHQSSSG